MTVAPAAVLRGAMPDAPAAAQAGARNDWAREFQAAGRLAWFHAPNEPGGADPLRRPAPEGARRQGHKGGERPSGSASSKAVQALPVAGPMPLLPPVGALADGRSAAGMHLPLSLPRSALTAAASNQVHRDAGIAFATPASPSRLSFSRTTGSQPCPTAWPATTVPAPQRRSPLRVHLDASEGGVTVWLGVDGGAPAEALRTGVAAELRRLLAASGQRLDALFCNGRPVDAVPPPQHREP